MPLLAQSPLNPGAQNLFAITNDQLWTHVRLNIFPDGGVARLRVYGIVVPDWSKVKPSDLVDLAAVEKQMNERGAPWTPGRIPQLPR